MSAEPAWATDPDKALRERDKADREAAPYASGCDTLIGGAVALALVGGAVAGIVWFWMMALR